MNIDKIISEEVNKLINEDTSARVFNDALTKCYSDVLSWLKNCRENNRATGKYRFQGIFQFEFNLLQIFGAKARGNVGKLIRNNPVYVRVTYLPEESIPGNIVGKSGEAKIKGELYLIVDITAGKLTSAQKLLNVLKHELTHIVDTYIFKHKKISSNVHSHQPSSMPPFPYCIAVLLYRLWDTTEFNAWQTTYENVRGGLNGYVEEMMKALNDANNIDEPFFWSFLGGYLSIEQRRTRTGGERKVCGRDLSNTPPEAVKKYFITTSFNLLKKFIKKLKF